MKIVNYLICKVIFVSCMMLTTGCSQEDPSMSSLNLVSPNGIRISKDINSLKQETSTFISLLNDGIEIDFEITNIDYRPVSKGFAALIEYKLNNGNISTFLLLSNDANVELSANLMVLHKLNGTKLKNGSETGGGTGMVSCVGTSPCQKCKLVETVNLVTGLVYYECNEVDCAKCAMHVSSN